MDLNSYQQFTGLESRCSHSMENQAIERGERSVCHHVYLETLNCIIKRSCIPCLYKLFPEGGKDVALAQVGTVALSGGIEVDHELLKRISLPCNQRPEQCPRSKPSPEVQSNTLYSPSTGQTKIAGAPTSILTVGDGDFTFSLSLATLLRTKEGSNQMEITATSHESQQSVLTTYKPHSQETLAQLKALGATVLHGVDATDLANTPELCKSSKHKKRKHDDDVGDDINTSDKVKMKRHDVVVWNFPCISLPAGADGQARELQANKELLAKFFANVRRCLTKGTGEVHISHKTIEPFSWWGMRQIAAENGFDFAYAVVFDRCVYPGYTNRKALDRKSFPCNDAQIYVFVPKSHRATATEEKDGGEGDGDVDRGEAATAAVAAGRTRLQHLLNHGVVVSLQDRRIARKIWNYLTTTYPAT